MTATETACQTIGAIAFKHDRPLSSNPYRFPQPCANARRMEQAWESGWKAAQKADWQYFPMAGRT